MPGAGREVSVDPAWTAFRDRFLDVSGRIVDTGNGGISHSEGQGYGMVMAARAGDRAAFERMAGWTETTLARHDVTLYAWKFVPDAAVAVPDRNNATDGDLLIAWAYALAAQRWSVPAWEARSAAIRRAIRTRLVMRRHGRSWLLPGLDGFATASAITLNPSYFVWPALDLFRRLDGDAAWKTLIEDAEHTVAAARFGLPQLPTDWVEVQADGALTPSRSHPPRFGFDAVRIPLYALAGHRAGLVAPIVAFWRRKLAEGRALPAWIDVATLDEASYPLSPGGMAIADRALGHPPRPQPPARDYYGAALQALAASLT
jgi:endoglucanase